MHDYVPRTLMLKQSGHYPIAMIMIAIMTMIITIIFITVIILIYYTLKQLPVEHPELWYENEIMDDLKNNVAELIKSGRDLLKGAVHASEG